MKTRVQILTFLVCLLLSSNIFAADEWVSVRSANFHLIGNAKEADIRSVAIKLEQFRQVFGHLFPNIKLNDPVETNVIVFKNMKSYEPFLPKTDRGRPDREITGFFIGDNESSYITLSAEGTKKDTYEIIFHEYVHFLLNNNFKRSEIPPWLGEGLAEYHSTFRVEGGRKAILGILRNDHLRLLNSNDLIPLDEFFKLDNYSLHQKRGHSRSIFYAQAWALVHYFAVRGQSDRLSRFVELSRADGEPEIAFKKAFGLDFRDMEAFLRVHIKQKKFTRLVASFKERLSFESDLQSGPITEFEAFGFLGDLLYRMQEFKVAENLLERALAGDPDQVRANTSLALVKLRLNKEEEARPYVLRAVANGRTSYYAHYTYAYFLSRENMDGAGFVSSFDKEKADLIRGSLKKAIELNPGFIESYNLYAFVNIVTDQDLDVAVAYLEKALALQPGSERLSLSLAQAYIRQNKFEESEAIANDIMKSAYNDTLRDQAASVLEMAAERRRFEAQRRERMERFERGGDPDGKGTQRRRRLSDAEVEKIRAEHHMTRLNSEIVQADAEERQAVGYFERIVCRGSNISYRFKTIGGETINLSSYGFQDLELLAIVDIPENEVFGCGFSSGTMRAVVNFRPGKASGAVLTAVTFVPSIFKLKSAEETERDRKIIFLRNPETGEMTPFEDVADAKEEQTWTVSIERARKSRKERPF